MIKKLSYQNLRLSENKSLLRHDTVHSIFYSQKIEKTNSSNNTYAFIHMQGSERTCLCHNFTIPQTLGAVNLLYKCYFDSM